MLGYLGGYLGLEFVSLIIRVGINFKSGVNEMITLGDNGYKFKFTDKEKEIMHSDDKNKSKMLLEIRSTENKPSNFSKVMNGIMCFIPGVNLIRPIVNLVKSHNINYIKKNINEDKLEEMTLEEKKAYSSLDKTSEKCVFIVSFFAQDEKEKKEFMVMSATMNEKNPVDIKQNRVRKIDEIFKDNPELSGDTLFVSDNLVIDVPAERTEENEKYFEHLELFRERCAKLDELLARKEERDVASKEQFDNKDKVLVLKDNKIKNS